jgi:multisubunit Na+/H+ antiporter MnhE subunit
MGRSWLMWWALLVALYLLLADSVAVPELATGAIAAAVGATGAVVVRRRRQVLLCGRPAWLRAVWRPALALVTDVWPLARVLVERGVLRRGEGALVEVPFAATSDGAEDTARRAVTEALGTLGPNTLVVEIDTDRGVLVAHQLRPTKDPASRAAPLP